MRATIVTAALLLATPALAQDSPETVRFVEAVSSQDWEKAERAYARLLDESPAEAKDPANLYKYALTLFSEKKLERAAEQLDALVEAEPENVRGLLLLARIKAVGKGQAVEDAKQLLLTAGRNGLAVLREVRAQKELKAFLDDPRFVLAAMRAWQEFVAEPRRARNPFAVPKLGKDGKPPEPPISKEQLRKLAGQIEALFAEIDASVARDDYEGLGRAFTHLDELLVTYRESAREQAADQLEKWAKKLGVYRELRLEVLFHLYVTEGNEHLRTMARAIDHEQFDEVRTELSRLDQLVEKMRLEPREDFKTTADELHRRGLVLAAEAAKRKKIQELDLNVTGIVLDPAGKSTTIIAFGNERGTVYREGETIRDREGLKIEGLEVVKIVEGAVDMRYDGIRFTRPLRNPKR
jgi:hypothetical protein